MDSLAHGVAPLYVCMATAHVKRIHVRPKSDGLRCRRTEPCAETQGAWANRGNAAIKISGAVLEVDLSTGMIVLITSR